MNVRQFISFPIRQIYFYWPIKTKTITLNTSRFYVPTLEAQQPDMCHKFQSASVRMRVQLISACSCCHYDGIKKELQMEKKDRKKKGKLQLINVKGRTKAELHPGRTSSRERPPLDDNSLQPSAPGCFLWLLWWLQERMCVCEQRRGVIRAGSLETLIHSDWV